MRIKTLSKLLNQDLQPIVASLLPAHSADLNMQEVITAKGLLLIIAKSRGVSPETAEALIDGEDDLISDRHLATIKQYAKPIWYAFGGCTNPDSNNEVRSKFWDVLSAKFGVPHLQMLPASKALDAVNEARKLLRKLSNQPGRAVNTKPKLRTVKSGDRD